ncbi:MAG: hypothetical protein M3O34_09855 [Chloroflexota bacterium]|nr:hypothetical protein [Chloroflexota bacterium]
MAVELTSRRHVVEGVAADPAEAIEFCYRQGWTDGLPVVPPTEALTAAFLEGMGLAPTDVVGEIPARARRFTAEVVAINAVMAGCLPEYGPVVRAAVEAMCAPEHNVNGAAASTGGSAPLTIVSGPIAQRIGMNGGGNLFGPGNRANATIGRALRLLLMNAGGATPGVMDKSTLGHPGKYSYCIAELTEGNPWPPLHARRGLPAEASAVTVFAGEAPHYATNHHSGDAAGVLRTVAGVMAASGYRGGAYVVVLCPEHLGPIVREAWSAEDVQAFLAREAKATVAELKRNGRMGGDPEPGDEERVLHAVGGPEDVLVLVGGGPAGGFSAVIPPWAGGRSSRPVTREIIACA